MCMRMPPGLSAEVGHLGQRGRERGPASPGRPGRPRPATVAAASSSFRLIFIACTPSLEGGEPRARGRCARPAACGGDGRLLAVGRGDRSAMCDAGCLAARGRSGRLRPPCPGCVMWPGHTQSCGTYLPPRPTKLSIEESRSTCGWCDTGPGAVLQSVPTPAETPPERRRDQPVRHRGDLPGRRCGPVRLPRRQAGNSPQGLAVTLLADYTLRTRAWLPSAAIVALLAEAGVSQAGRPDRDQPARPPRRAGGPPAGPAAAPTGSPRPPPRS